MDKVVRHTLNQEIKDERLLELSQEAACVYDFCLEYFWNQVEINNRWMTDYDIQKELYPFFKTNNYKLSSNTIIETIQLFRKAIMSYLAAKKEFKKNPAAFSGMPKPPKRIKTIYTLAFKESSITFKKGFLGLSLAKGNKPISIRWNIKKLGKPKYATINWTPNIGWMAHFVMEKTVEYTELDSEKSMGIDLGIKRIATSFDGKDCTIYSGKHLKSLIRLREKLKAEKSTKLSFLTKHSRKYKKINKAYRRIFKKIDNRINDFLHKTSRTIVNDARKKKIKKIYVGDCADIHQNTNLGKRNNQAIGQFAEQRLLEMLKYKFENISGTLKVISEKYTSKTCPKCGHQHKPSNRTYKCKPCGFVYDRDGVGSLNIWGLGNNVSLGNVLNVVGCLMHPVGRKYHSSNLCLANLWG